MSASMRESFVDLTSLILFSVLLGTDLVGVFFVDRIPKKLGGMMGYCGYVAVLVLVFWVIITCFRYIWYVYVAKAL